MPHLCAVIWVQNWLLDIRITIEMRVEMSMPSSTVNLEKTVVLHS